MIIWYLELQESIHVLRKLISFLVKYEIPKNINVSIGHQPTACWPPMWQNDARKKRNNIGEIFNYMHKAPSGHHTTCKQNHGMDYGSLETCFMKTTLFKWEGLICVWETTESYGQLH
jgi:hypothetical protein